MKLDTFNKVQNHSMFIGRPGITPQSEQDWSAGSWQYAGWYDLLSADPSNESLGARAVSVEAQEDELCFYGFYVCQDIINQYGNRITQIYIDVVIANNEIRVQVGETYHETLTPEQYHFGLSLLEYIEELGFREVADSFRPYVEALRSK